MHSKERLGNDLRRLGVGSGDTVMVHASVRAVGEVAGHRNWPDRFFANIVEAYLSETENQGGRVGNAMSYVLHARGLLDFASPIMEAVATEPRAIGRDALP